MFPIQKKTNKLWTVLRRKITNKLSKNVKYITNRGS